MSNDRCPFHLAHFLFSIALAVANLHVSSAFCSEVVVKRVIRSSAKASNQLRDNAWRPWGKGYRQQAGVFACDNADDSSAHRGVSQTIELNQMQPEPIVASAWSRAERVSGSPDANYSVYLDLIFQDGTHLWGQHAPFETDTHTWQQRRVVVLPEKPVRRVTFYLLSRYPLGAVTNDQTGVALAIDMSRPAFFRIGYSGGTQELYLAYDIALTPEKPRARLRFCHFRFEPEWGFRAALEQLYQLFPQQFQVRVPEHGLWMPFAKISQVQQWQDFGFQFKEGNNETAWDDEQGITTFRYTEPMTWWMKLPAGTARSRKAARQHAERLAEDPANLRAQALIHSGYRNRQGELVARILDTPWCDGAVWSMNSMPAIPGKPTDFSVKWNAELQQQLYGPDRKADLDGEYMKRSLAYGFFPGFFSHNASQGHYFSRPELYQRDRDLFKQYMPLCKRLSEAGWRPVTGARSSNDQIHLERFGERYLTVFNDSTETHSTSIHFDPSRWPVGQPVQSGNDLTNQHPLSWQDDALHVTLESEDIAVIDMSQLGW